MHVSVVLPTRDRAAVLGDAVESVLGQTYDDLDLLVVDGGSTDDTPEVVAEFDDDRLSYRRREEPAGVGAARNVGVEATDGDLVAFVDSDDRWHPDKLRRQVAALRERGGRCGVAYGPVTKDEGEPRTRDGASGDVYDPVRRLAVPTYTSTLVVRREAFEACGGFDERLGCFEDWDLCLRLARDWEFAWVDAPLVEKGTGTDNVSADPDRLAAALERLLGKHDLPPEARARLLADAGRTYCEAGRLAAGRPYLRRALENEFGLKAALALALALSGSPEAFEAGMAAVYAVERRLAAGS